jgi:hypothetical protein
MGTHAVALGQEDNLRGQTFTFVGNQAGDQLPSAFLEPAVGGALGAFESAGLEAPSEATITARTVLRPMRRGSY